MKNLKAINYMTLFKKTFRTKNTLFHWRGVDKHGQPVSGTSIASTKIEIEKKFLEKNIIITAVTAPLHLRRTNIKSTHILEFTRQMATLLQTGIHLDKSIGLLLQNNNLIALRNILDTIKKDLDQGQSLSAALAKHPKYFKPLYVHLVAAGEQTGQLVTLMKQLVHFSERLHRTKMKIKKALFYPLMVLGISILVSLGLLIFVVPQFQNVFSSFGAQLPWFTQTVIHIADHLKKNFAWLSTGIFSVTLFFKKYISYFPKIIYFFEKIKMKLPLFGKMIEKANIIQWTTVLSTALRAGIASFPALMLADQIIQNPSAEKSLGLFEQQVKGGLALHQAMLYCSVFPHSLVELIRVGEESGTLAEMLEKTAATYAEELDHALDQLTKMLEPLTMLFVAGMAGSLIIAMYLPVFKMGSVM